MALRRELGALSARKAGGIRGVAVKCLDITKNPDCEGSLPQRKCIDITKNPDCEGSLPQRN